MILKDDSERQQINSFGYGKNDWLTNNPIKVKIDYLKGIKKNHKL